LAVGTLVACSETAPFVAYIGLVDATPPRFLRPTSKPPTADAARDAVPFEDATEGGGDATSTVDVVPSPDVREDEGADGGMDAPVADGFTALDSSDEADASAAVAAEGGADSEAGGDL
jgi:hypothetical protein